MSQSSSRFTAYPMEDFRRSESDLIEAAARVLRGGHYILGPEVALFEKEWAAWCGVSEVIGVANGTDAIELLLLAHGIGSGDCVALPSHTAVASVSAVRRTGADPVYVDIDPDHFTICPHSLRKALESPVGKSIKVVLAVHIYGHPCDMEGLQALCEEYGVILLEDGAQSHGATWQGKRVGSLASGAAFSFYPTKNLGAVGDGGAIATNDSSLAERIREIRQYGWRERYISSVQGVNSRRDEMQAAILRVKLRGLEASVARRQQLADRYHAALSGHSGIRLPSVKVDCTHAYHLFVIRSRERNNLMQYLLGKKIPVALHYPAAVHQQLGYAKYQAHSPALQNTEIAVQEILTLPLHPWLQEEAIDEVISAIEAWGGSQKNSSSLDSH